MKKLQKSSIKFAECDKGIESDKVSPIVFVVSHSLPLAASYDQETDIFTLRPVPEETDNMINSLYRLRRHVKGHKLIFVGWPHLHLPVANDQINDSRERRLKDMYLREDCLPVFLDEELFEKHQRFCFTYLWPITHNVSIFMPQSSACCGAQIKVFLLRKFFF